MALASAGARTLAELAAGGIPAVVVPLPGAARNHQAVNAKLYAAQTGGYAVLESPLDALAVAAHVAALVANPEELRRLGSKAAAGSRPNAACDVVRACEAMMAARDAVIAAKQMGGRAESYTG
jgi:UDP-N-acetylglucosamine--N-acetylmuramyl-(pentapeptide) pyrophosphoryl-undecaprenol N-acetylglucosamine transferase